MQFVNHVKELETKLHDNEQLLATFADNLEEQIENLKGDYIELLNQQASHRNELSMIEEQSKQQNSKNERLDEENAKYVEMRMEITAKKTKLVESYEQVKRKSSWNPFEYTKDRSGTWEMQGAVIVKTKQNCIKHINLYNRHVLEKKC